jgi:hypothetical protein
MAAVTSAVDRIRFDADPDPDSLSILMPIQIRILQYGTVRYLKFTLCYLSHQCHRCHNFQYLRQDTELTFSRKKDSLFSHLTETNTDPETIPIHSAKLLPQKDADPTGSRFECESTTLMVRAWYVPTSNGSDSVGTVPGTILILRSICTLTFKKRLFVPTRYRTRRRYVRYRTVCFRIYKFCFQRLSVLIIRQKDGNKKRIRRL